MYVRCKQKTAKTGIAYCDNYRVLQNMHPHSAASKKHHHADEKVVIWCLLLVLPTSSTAHNKHAMLIVGGNTLQRDFLRAASAYPLCAAALRPCRAAAGVAQHSTP